MLHADNCLDERNWTSQGILGKMLENVPNHLRNSPLTSDSVDADTNAVSMDTTSVIAE